MYRSTYSSPRNWMEVSGKLHAPAALLPPVPTGCEVVWAPEPVRTTWRREKSRPYSDSNSDSSAVQSVASRYIGCAIPAGIAQSVQRRATGLMAGVRIPPRAREHSLLHSVQTGCGIHPTSHPVVKRLGREANHSSPSSAEVRMEELYSHSPT
jgi:hypothetical protein